MSVSVGKLARQIYNEERVRLVGAIKIVLTDKAIDEEWDPKDLTPEQVKEVLEDFRTNADEAIAEAKREALSTEDDGT